MLSSSWMLGKLQRIANTHEKLTPHIQTHTLINAYFNGCSIDKSTRWKRRMLYITCMYVCLSSCEVSFLYLRTVPLAKKGLSKRETRMWTVKSPIMECTSCSVKVLPIIPADMPQGQPHPRWGCYWPHSQWCHCHGENDLDTSRFLYFMLVRRQSQLILAAENESSSRTQYLIILSFCRY